MKPQNENICSECKQKKEIVSKGLCRNCYSKQHHKILMQKNPRYNIEMNLKHREARIKKAKKYYQNNKEELIEQQKARQKRDSEMYKVRQETYRNFNSEKKGICECGRNRIGNKSFCFYCGKEFILLKEKER